jgi:hypothetical protein
VDYIYISRDEPQPESGLFHIGVYGAAANTEYEITAHTKNSFITLINGWQQRYQIKLSDKDKNMYFRYQSKGDRNITCTLETNNSGFDPIVYVKRQEPTASARFRPSESNYDQKFSDAIFDQMRLNLTVYTNWTEYLFAVTFNETT